ncbi:MAG: nucleotidyltransferase domain-containing protein [Candidatus Bathyarchaeia archaeon]
MRVALERQRIFDNLGAHLLRIREVAQRIDANAEAYIFGSVAEGRSIYSSDIDVLIITKVEPAKVLMELWRAGIGDPFEIHVQPPEMASPYRRRARLVKIQ